MFYLSYVYLHVTYTELYIRTCMGKQHSAFRRQFRGRICVCVGLVGLASPIFALGNVFFIGKQGVILLPLKLRFRDQEVDY